MKALKEEVTKAFNEGRVEYIKDGDLTIGFFNWDTYVREGKLFVYLYNFFISPGHRNKNLLYLRDKFRKKFPNATFYWEREKYHTFKYTI